MNEQWEEWICSQETRVILDGGLGEILQARGNDLSEGLLWSGRMLVTKPDDVRFQKYKRRNISNLLRDTDKCDSLMFLFFVFEKSCVR